MRIAIAQLDYTLTAFDHNLARITRAVDEARSAGADLVVLSELATIGYPPGDLLDRPDVVARNLEQLERVAALSDDRTGILVGYVEPNPNEDGKRLYNAAALCDGGRVVASTRKCLLPTYDVFDEARHFEPGGPVTPLDFRGVPLGVSICEDVWADPDDDGVSLYHRDPVTELVEAGARLLVNLSASPFELGKAAQRRELVRRYAADSGRFFCYVNQVGGNSELVFDGHSLVVDGQGRVVARARDFAEDVIVSDVPDRALGARSGAAGAPGPVREVADGLEAQAMAALELGLRDYVRKSGFERVVLGLSGGIDSALTAAIAARALGPEQVLGVALPSRYSSDHSLRDAQQLAHNLGIDYRVISIDGMYQASLDALEPVLAGREPDVTEENLQARARGVVLMGISNAHGRLLLATGNKSELAVGYCTLYGDMCGGLAPIADVPKTLVYRLSRWLNHERELIPESTLTKPPSAELRPDQTDQDSLPPYDVVDRIVELYVERHRSVADIVATGLDPAAVAHVVGLIDTSEYKRRQAAPGIKITAKAFGIGRRVPIVKDTTALHRHG
jgi:NAD+ synthetase